jgi:arylsulfatase A-like enzyme
LSTIGLMATTPACKDSSGSEGKAKAAPTRASTAPVSARTGQHTWRALVDEAARAEIHAGGVLIDFGTADQHKYTRGGWNTGWERPARIEGVSVGVIAAPRAHIDVVTGGPTAELVTRLRSSKAGPIQVHIDGKAAGAIEATTSFSLVRLPLSAALAAGRHRIELRTVKGKRSRRRVHIDWLWLANKAKAEPPELQSRVKPMNLGGGVRRALVAPTSRDYVFHLEVPAKASLVFDHAAPKSADIQVIAQVDGAEPRTLLNAKAGPKWKEAHVDLGPIAGKAARLVLRSKGAGVGWGEPEIMMPGKPAATRPRKKARATIVILIDTLRADELKVFNPKSKTHTPAYDSVAKQGTVFANAYNNENWTKPSVATFLSGVYPSTHDTKRDASRLPREVEIISQRMKAQGVRTAGFMGNGYISHKYGFAKGWDELAVYWGDRDRPPAEKLFGDAMKWLKKHKDERFFLYIQTFDPHVNLDVDKRYVERYFPGSYSGPMGDVITASDQAKLSTGKIPRTEENLNWIKAHYRGEISYHDEHMGNFLRELERMKLVDDVLLVIANDHGEELGDHGKFGHGHSLYDDMIRSPLTMRLPGLFTAGAAVDEIVEHVDVAPTIFDVMGLQSLPHAEGRSLVPLVRGKPAQRPYYAVFEMLDNRRGIRIGHYKLLLGPGLDVLFDLEADPKENKSIYESHPIARRMAEVYLGEALATPSKGRRQQDVTERRKFKASKVKISKRVRRQLEALGYFGEH